MKNIAIVLSDGFEEIEAISVIDVLRRGTCHVDVFGLNGITVTGSHEITIDADEIFEYYNVLKYDGIVLVGGMKNAINLSGSNDVIKLLEDFNDKGKLVAGICATPAVVFSKTNILKDKNATCYPDNELIAQLGVNRFVDSLVVVSGNIITSQSPSTAIDFAIAILKYLELDADGVLKGLMGK